MTATALRVPAARTVRPLRSGRDDARAALTAYSGLLLVRTFTDASVLSDTVSYLLNIAVAVAAIAVALGLVLLGRAGRGTGIVATTALVVTGLGMLAVVQFGVQASLVGEYLRFGSILAMAVLMRAALQGGVSPVEAVRRSLAVCTPAVLLVLIGYLGHVRLLADAASGRVEGTFNQRNGAAAFIAVYVVTALWVALSERRRSAWAQVVVGFVAIAGTLSLGGLAAAVTGTAALLLLYLPRLPAAARVLLVALFLAAIVLVLTNSGIQARLVQLNGHVSFTGDISAQKSDNSLQWRIVNWEELLPYFAQRPVAGWGFGTTSALIQPLGQLPHNEYVRTLVEGGVVGALFVLGLVVAAVVRLVRTARLGTAGTLHLLGAAALVTALVDATVSNTLSYPPMMFLLAGVLVIADAAARPAAAAPAAPPVPQGRDRA